MNQQSNTQPRHFLEETDLSREEFNALISHAIELKSSWKRGEIRDTLHNRVLAMIFEKASTRTRSSFEAGIAQLGGHALNLTPADSQLGRGEPIADTSRVLSEMVDAAMLRTHSHDTIAQFAVADMQTFVELRGSVEGACITWLGAGNNVCNSYVNTAKLLGFTLRVACPKELKPDQHLLTAAGDHVELYDDVKAACDGADAIVTDVWASMGEEQNADELHQLLGAYKVTDDTMKLAGKDAIFMHCLPAHRGEEVEGSVIDGSQSVVWQEAGNRLHAQKALLELLIL